MSGASEVCTFDRVSGDVRRLTKTPEEDGGAEFTADGNGVVFNRVARQQRFFSTDLTKWLAGAH